MNNEGLFQAELEVIDKAHKALDLGRIAAGPSAESFQWLLQKYQKLFQQTRRLIRFSDRMQNDLTRLNRQLCQSEAKYRNIFENATEGIFRADHTGRLTEVNPAMAHILGYLSPQQLLDRGAGDKSLEDQEGYRKFLDLIRETGGCRQHQTELATRTGDVIWVEINAQPTYDESGRMTHVDGLLSDITQKKYLQENLTRLAHTDELTGIFNRRRFVEILGKEIRWAKRKQTALSLLMLDVDFFKTINDSFGHDAGDRVLQRLTDLCRKVLREKDILGRLGGEEFAVALPAAGQTVATRIAERLCRTIEKEEIRVGRQTVRITVSIGLSLLDDKIRTPETLFKAADEALYRAKYSGRNKVCVYAEPAASPHRPLEFTPPLASG